MKPPKSTMNMKCYCKSDKKGFSKHYNSSSNDN